MSRCHAHATMDSCLQFMLSGAPVGIVEASWNIPQGWLDQGADVPVACEQGSQGRDRHVTTRYSDHSMSESCPREQREQPRDVPPLRTQTMSNAYREIMVNSTFAISQTCFVSRLNTLKARSLISLPNRPCNE